MIILKIAVIYNEKKDKDNIVINDIKKAFDKRAVLSIFTEKITADKLCDADMVVALGGDGTIIRASKAAAVHGLPVCGVNLGKIGFLATIERNEIFKMADNLLCGNYSVEERMMLDISTYSEKGPVSARALNDVAIHRGSYHKMIDISIGMGGEPLDQFRADGVIISTPTGSTAYSLSAGGPVCSPLMELFLVTPVCAYDVRTKNMVLTAEDTLTLAVGGRGEAMVEVDGTEMLRIKPGDEIKISKSANKAKIVKMGDRSFYQILRNKF